MPRSRIGRMGQRRRRFASRGMVGPRQKGTKQRLERVNRTEDWVEEQLKREEASCEG